MFVPLISCLPLHMQFLLAIVDDGNTVPQPTTFFLLDVLSVYKHLIPIYLVGEIPKLIVPKDFYT